MGKLKNKKQVAYTIPIDVANKFDNIANKIGSNKSKVIQILLEKWIKENAEK